MYSKPTLSCSCVCAAQHKQTGTHHRNSPPPKIPSTTDICGTLDVLMRKQEIAITGRQNRQLAGRDWMGMRKGRGIRGSCEGWEGGGDVLREVIGVSIEGLGFRV